MTVENFEKLAKNQKTKFQFEIYCLRNQRPWKHKPINFCAISNVSNNLWPRFGNSPLCDLPKFYEILSN